MSENKRNWTNIAIGAFIILAIVLLIALILPFSNLAVANDEIAVININGAITYSESNTTAVYMTAREIENCINDAESDKNVKAIVLDINSYGGSLVASEEISNMIKNSSKPVVSYIGDKGMDEAYLIASSANYTVASPSSSVGGIGLSYKNSTKYSKDNLSAHFNKKYLNSNQTNKSSVSAQVMIDQDYTYLIGEIAKNRDMKAKKLAELANGTKYNGNEAKNLGLIDKIGNKNQAIKIAASKSNATNYTVVNYPKSEKSLTESLYETNIFNLFK